MLTLKIAVVSLLTLSLANIVSNPAPNGSISSREKSCSVTGVKFHNAITHSFGTTGGVQTFHVAIQIDTRAKNCLSSVEIEGMSTNGNKVKFEPKQPLRYQALKSGHSLASASFTIDRIPKLNSSSLLNKSCRPVWFRAFYLVYTYGAIHHNAEVAIDPMYACVY